MRWPSRRSRGGGGPATGVGAALRPVPPVVLTILPVVLATLRVALIAAGASLAPSSVPAQEFACPARLSCSLARSCREAVGMWCACGYGRADADKDGVPCEALCGEGSASSRTRVAGIAAQLGCSTSITGNPGTADAPLAGLADRPASLVSQSLSLSSPRPSSRSSSCGARRYCGDMRSCREAVHEWALCGYEGADADKDGVPCESVCGEGNAASRERISRILDELGATAP